MLRQTNYVRKPTSPRRKRAQFCNCLGQRDRHRVVVVSMRTSAGICHPSWHRSFSSNVSARTVDELHDIFTFEAFKRTNTIGLAKRIGAFGNALVA